MNDPTPAPSSPLGAEPGAPVSRDPARAAPASRPNGVMSDAAIDVPSPRRAAPPSPKPLPSDGVDRRARVAEIERAIADLFYRAFDERCALTGLGATPRPTKLELSLSLSPHEHPHGDLAEQIERAAARLADRCAAFPAGHVHCYWCRSFHCEHSRPPGPREVFTGYSATGQPLWREFASVLLDRSDPRVDLLFAGGGNTLALTQTAVELVDQQLSIYGRHSPIYRILGQVSLGYLKPPKVARGHAISNPFAVTFQAVEAAGGASPAHLNILATADPALPITQTLEEFYDPRIQDAVGATRRRLAEIALRGSSRRRRRDRERQVMEALRALAKNLDRIFRQSRRRTLHSQDRRREGCRPTSVAVRDALGARPDRVYRDVEENTWVILGPKCRVHVFNDAGRHVTSVVYPGETVRGRTTKGKWVTPPPGDATAFLARLGVSAGGDQEPA